MMRNIREEAKIMKLFAVWRIVGIDIRRTISISKTMKIIASKKNRVEKGIRAVLLGSNPHSNGEDFSRSSDDRVAKIHAAINTTEGIKIAIIEEVVTRFIN